MVKDYHKRCGLRRYLFPPSNYRRHIEWHKHNITLRNVKRLGFYKRDTGYVAGKLVYVVGLQLWRIGLRFEIHLDEIHSGDTSGSWAN
jgi:hypothetical protein